MVSVVSALKSLPMTYRRKRKVLGLTRCLIAIAGMVLSSLVGFVTPSACADDATGNRQLWVTMHTTTLEEYCTPCILSERLLKEANVQFKKVLEPMGPWPWFQLTDDKGNQCRLNGGLTQEDVDAIKRGEFPERD